LGLDGKKMTMEIPDDYIAAMAPILEKALKEFWDSPTGIVLREAEKKDPGTTEEFFKMAFQSGMMSPPELFHSIRKKKNDD